MASVTQEKGHVLKINDVSLSSQALENSFTKSKMYQVLGREYFTFWRSLKTCKNIKELVMQEPFFMEVSMLVCFSSRNNRQYKYLMKTFIYLTELTQKLEIGMYLLKNKKSNF